MLKRSWVCGGAVALAAIVGTGACGSDADDSVFPRTNDGSDAALGDGSGGTVDDDGSTPIFGDEDSGTKSIASLTIDPPTATLDLKDAPYPTQKFKVTAQYKDGTSGLISPTWSASEASVGSISSAGLYTPHGQRGGIVRITATAGGQKVTATLTVKLHQLDNPAGVDDATQASLIGATTADANVVWTYPYDGMAYARGLNAPSLMWNKGASGDVYLVRLTSPTYDLQVFTSADVTTKIGGGTTPQGPRNFAFDPARWTAFTDSTSGEAKLTVARKTGSTFTRVVEQTWSIASRSMSGTIYYWAINKAAVVRIKPGAQTPDYFLGSATVPPPGEWNAPNNPTTKMFCPSCHTASADGSTLVMGTGYWGNVVDVWSSVYDLQADKTVFHGYQTNAPPTRLALAGVTPDGKIAVENWANIRGAGGKDDLPIDLTAATTTATSLPTIAGTDLDTLVGAGHHTYFPTFSADNEYFAYVDSQDGALYGLDWDAKTKKFSNRVKLVDTPAGTNKIAYPTLSPDHRWVVYQIGPDYGSLAVSFLGDLYAVDTKNPNHAIALDAINKTLSPAAGEARDQHRSYEPTFAPVASGGYFWLVFHSRRTYGNLLVDIPYKDGTEGSGTKQLWVAALDVAGASTSTEDPSHPPFWLPGQDPTTRNMRAYWALDPCKGDGESCTSGTDCCNGFCDASNDAGTAICGSSSTGCSQIGDRCDVAADCCNDVGVNVTCINHVCSELPPN